METEEKAHCKNKETLSIVTHRTVIVTRRLAAIMDGGLCAGVGICDVEARRP